MKKNNFILLSVLILVVAVFLFILNTDKLIWSYYYNKLTNNQPSISLLVETNKTEVEVIVISPESGEIVASPLEITGQARGYWFFEGDLPVKLVAIHGKVLATGMAKAQGEWMTEDFVDFTASLTFSTPDIDQGELIFIKDNPSGLPENAGEFRVPVKFELE